MSNYSLNFELKLETFNWEFRYIYINTLTHWYVILGLILQLFKNKKKSIVTFYT